MRMRACWRSVSPTHLERNSPISMTGRAHSLAKQSMRKDLPTPTRPGTRTPRSSTSVLPFLMSQASSRSRFLAAVCVATRSRVTPGFGSLKRTRPWQYSSIRRFLLAVTCSCVTRMPLRMASARKWRMRSRFSPEVRAASSLGGEIAPVGEGLCRRPSLRPSRIGGSGAARRHRATRCAPGRHTDSGAGRALSLVGGFGDQHDADVQPRELRRGGPLEERDQVHPFLHAGVGFLAGGDELLRKIDHQGDAPPLLFLLGDAQEEPRGAGAPGGGGPAAARRHGSWCSRRCHRLPATRRSASACRRSRTSGRR